MGVENNNAVLATTWNDECVLRVTRWIGRQTNDLRGLFAVVPGIAEHKTTIVLCPDGSKEGWEISDRGDDLRQRFIDELAKDDYEDGSSPWDWVEVGYGEYGQKVLRGNNVNYYNNAEHATAT